MSTKKAPTPHTNTPLQIFSANHSWEDATCLNRHDEFCPKEEIMVSPQWAKSTAPKAAIECLSCPLFNQCKEFLLEQMKDEEIPTVGVMAGVVLMQKSVPQIEKGLERAEELRQLILRGEELPPSAQPTPYEEAPQDTYQPRRILHGNSRQARENKLRLKEQENQQN